MQQAILTCSDGVEIKISAETEKEMREKFGPKKPKFELIKHCHLRIGINENSSRVILTWAGNEKDYCSECPGAIRYTIKSLQSAIDFIENQ